jgi:hypothetical protein
MPTGNDGAILDRLVAALRRDGPSQKLQDSVPTDLWRKALRLW